MDSPEGGGGKTTLFIVVFFLCVISAVVGYFQYTISSQTAEAEQKIKDIQAKAAAEMSAAKSDEEKREIQRKADLEMEQAKMKSQTDAERATLKAQSDAEKKALASQAATLKAQSDAEKKALANREAKIKAAEAAVNKKLKDAAATVKNAQNLQNQAKKVKADADKKKKDADAAMAKAVASGKAADQKLATESKKLADAANAKVAAANKAAAAAKAQAVAEGKKALQFKQSLDQLARRANMVVEALVRLNAVPGYYKDGNTIVWGGEGPKTGDPRVCQQWAASSGYPAWGHRTANHPDPKWKNSCFGYKEVKAKYNTKHADEAHVVGCTFTDLRPDQTVCSLPKNFYRYVRIFRLKAYADHWLNLAGVDIISEGRNIASNAKITSSSVVPSAPPKNLIDGNMKTIAHTQNGLAEWFLFDFGKRVSIDKVVIWNRRDCCQARARDILVQLSNDNKNWINGPKIRPDRAGFWRHQWILGEDSFLSD